MASFAGEVLLRVKADFEKLKGDVEAAMKKAGEQGSKAFSKSFESAQARLSSTGASLTKSVTLPIVGLGGAAMAAAGSVDNALRDIRVGTGATGETLAQLNRDFEAVGKSSSIGLERVGVIIGDLNTRLGLTGEPLQALAGQIADLEAILGSEVNLDTVTRVFAAYGVGADEYQASLDKIFRASQATGVQFDALTGAVVSQSAAFSELGFGLDETTAIIAQFEKNGVNTETVIAALKQNIVKAAKEGKSASEFFRDGVAEIEGFLAAGDDASAQAAASELFGARTFLDALDAIKRGQFDIDGVLDQIQNGGDTIGGLADETQTFSQQMAEFKNRLTLSLAPLGQKLFPILTQAFEQILPPLISILDRFANMDPALQKIVIGVAAAAAALGPLLSIASKLIPLIRGVSAAFTFLAANPIVLVLAAIAAAAYLIYKNWDSIWPAIKTVGETIAEVAKAIAGWVMDYILKPIQTAFNWIRDNWREILSTIGDVLLAVLNAIKRWARSILGAFVGAFRAVWSAVGSVMRTIQRVIETVMGAIQTGIETALSAIRGAFEFARDVISAAWNTMATAIDTAGMWIRNVIDVINIGVDTMQSVIETASGFIIGIWEGIRDGVVGAIEAMIGWIQDLVGWFEKVGKGWWDTFQNIGYEGYNLITGNRAGGGPVRSGEPYLVGEVGPEIVIPGDSGTVISTAQVARALSSMGGTASGGDTYNIEINNPIAEPPSLSVQRLQRRQAALAGRSI